MPLDLTKTIKIGLAGVGDPTGIDVYDEGATEQFSEFGAEATWQVVCNYNDRIPLAFMFTGSYTVTGVVTQVTQPMAYPDAGWLFASSVRTEGIGTQEVGPHGMAKFDKARLTVTFKPKESGTLDSLEKGEETLDFGADVISFNGAEPFFKWSSDNKPLPPEASPGKIIPIITFTKVKKGVSSAALPTSTLFTIAKAPVNSTVYLGAEIGTLRFDGARTSKRFTTTGTTKDFEVKFSWRPIPWNHMLRPSTGNFEAIVTMNGGKPLYESSNFTPLGLE